MFSKDKRKKKGKNNQKKGAYNIKWYCSAFKTLKFTFNPKKNMGRYGIYSRMKMNTVNQKWEKNYLS